VNISALSKPVSKKPSESKTVVSKPKPPSSNGSPAKVSAVPELVAKGSVQSSTEDDDEFGITNANIVDSDEEGTMRHVNPVEACDCSSDTLQSLLEMKAR